MSKCQEIKDVERKIRNLINFLSEGEGKKFPSIKKELENLENKKKVLEFDLEGTRLSIQKEGQVKFEAKIVLNTLKDFAEKIDQIEPADRPHLFQYLIKSISYGKDEIVVEIFYLPPERVRVGGQILSSMCLKNRSKWLPLLDNFRTLHLRFENTIIRKN